VSGVDSGSFNLLSMCTGGWGLELGVELAVRNARVVCCVEREAFACEHLASKMEAGILGEAAVWTDARTFDGRPWRGIVDCLTAGDPCQGFSCAGKQLGEDDPRTLWPQVARIIEEGCPACVFRENVASGKSLRYYFGRVRPDLERLGYRVAEGLVTASQVGAPHKRERLFCLAHAEDADGRGELQPEGARGGRAGSTGGGRRLADAGREHEHAEQRASGVCEPAGEGLPLAPPGPGDIEAWKRVIADYPHLAPSAEPGLRVLVDGMAYVVDELRIDRIRLGGNGVHPLAAAYAWCALEALLRV
jgi:DNA (cytosine-5)-methyltransferase 1